MKINKKKIVMPGMRLKVTFIKLKIFRRERRRRRCEKDRVANTLTPKIQTLQNFPTMRRIKSF